MTQGDDVAELDAIGGVDVVEIAMLLRHGATTVHSGSARACGWTSGRGPRSSH